MCVFEKDMETADNKIGAKSIYEGMGSQTNNDSTNLNMVKNYHINRDLSKSWGITV